jgi:hypothetical protein
VPRIHLLLPLAAAFLAGASTRTASAQDVMDVRAATLVRDGYLADMDSVHSKVLALANAIPADKYSWRPGTGVRSVSEVFMHLAGEWYFYGPMSVGSRAPADFLVAGQKPQDRLEALEKIVDKAMVISELNKSWAYNRQQLAGADPSTMTGKYKPWGVTVVDAAFGMTGDQHEHLGQLIAYARSMGIKPPWTR